MKALKTAALAAVFVLLVLLAQANAAIIPPAGGLATNGEIAALRGCDYPPYTFRPSNGCRGWEVSYAPWRDTIAQAPVSTSVTLTATDWLLLPFALGAILALRKSKAQ